MTSSGPNMHAVIEQAAIKVNASVDKVKVSYFKLFVRFSRPCSGVGSKIKKRSDYMSGSRTVV